MDYSMVATAQIALLLYFWRERWLTCPIFFLLSFFLAFFFFSKRIPPVQEVAGILAITQGWTFSIGTCVSVDM